MLAQPPRGLPPQCSRFTTTDPDQAQDLIGRMYGARPPGAGRLDPASPLSISQVSAGGLSYVDFIMPPDLTLHLDGTDDLSVTTLITGTTHAELGAGTERYTAGDVCLVSFPHADYLIRCRQLRAAILTVPRAALAQAAGELPGQPRPSLRFPSLRPASPAAAGQWKSTAAYVSGLLDDDEAAASPLLTGSAARLLAAVALAAFPNNVLGAPATQDSRDARPATLRRALAFIDDNAHRDISTADIAAAAFVTARALQLAFRRHLDTTPLEYLRRVRLARAHRDLLAADPAAATVTAVAYRWGFPNSSRFAAYYRHAYGVSPGKTLHHD